MVRLRPGARAVFGEKLLDLANLAAAALVFGQFVGRQPLSLDGHCHGRDDLVRHCVDSAVDDGSLAVENAFGILIGITICVAIIALIDWFGRRKNRQSRNRAA